MKVKKRLNNNAIVGIDENQEVIVTGKGIGFGVQIGDDICLDKIEKTFVLQNASQSQMQTLFEQVPIEYIHLASEIYQRASEQIPTLSQHNLLLHLSDHLYTAVLRNKEGVNLKNALLWETKHFYPKEYQLGLLALELINERLHIALPDDEAGFIAIHLVNAQLKDGNLNKVNQMTQFIEEIETIIKHSLQITIDKNSFYYERFLTHLKFFAKRVLQADAKATSDDTEMLEAMKQKYPNSARCIEKI